jgi:hypothetical protein
MDDEISFTGDRNRIAGFPVLGVTVSSEVVLENRDIQDAQDILTASVVLTEEGSMPLRGAQFSVGIGDALPLRDHIYRVVKLRKATGTESLGAIWLQKESNPMVLLSNKSIVLQKRPGRIFFWYKNDAGCAIFLNSIDISSDGARLASIVWQDGPWNSWNRDGLEKNASNLPINALTVGEGSFVDLPNVGRLRVTSVVPEQPHQPAWLVMEFADGGDINSVTVH